MHLTCGGGTCEPGTKCLSGISSETWSGQSALRSSTDALPSEGETSCHRANARAEIGKCCCSGALCSPVATHHLAQDAFDREALVLKRPAHAQHTSLHQGSLCAAFRAPAARCAAAERACKRPRVRLWGGSSADGFYDSLKLDKAECEATHAQASQMLRRVGLGGEPVTRRRSCASRCSCWPTPSPSPSLVAVALLACCAYIGSRMCRARRRRQDFRREIVVNEIARQFRTAEETRQGKREYFRGECYFLLQQLQI